MRAWIRTRARGAAALALLGALFLPAAGLAAGKAKPGGKGPGKAPAANPMIGKAAPEINAKEWFNTKEPLSLEKLKGRIVVLEFWFST